MRGGMGRRVSTDLVQDELAIGTRQEHSDMGAEHPIAIIIEWPHGGRSRPIGTQLGWRAVLSERCAHPNLMTA